MRKSFLMLVPALALGLAACSESAQDNLSNSLDRTGDSIGNLTSDFGDVIENGADRAGSVTTTSTRDAYLPRRM